MRNENEVVQAVCEQVIHGIKKCGWDDSTTEDFSECVDMAIDMVVTDEEAEAYPDIDYLVKMSITF